MERQFNLVQIVTGMLNVAPELAAIIVSLPVLRIDLVDVARRRQKIAPDLPAALVVSEFPTHVPPHPVELMNGVFQMI